MERSDEVLMRAYREGDTMALNELFTRYKGRIVHFCIGLLGNRADAEEAAADVFMAVVRYKQSYDPLRTFSTWIYTIAHNTCVSRLRKKKRTISLWFQPADSDDERQMDLPDQGLDPAEQLNQKDIAACIKQAIERLSFEQKEALMLKQYQGCSYEEISRILNCSLDKVKILIFRAKEHLKVSLAYLVKEA